MGFRLEQVEFAEPALLELDDAAEFYELHLPGLGERFFRQLMETIDLIVGYPELWAMNSEHTRKAVLMDFPYNIIYSILDDKIYIVAIAHQNRAPEYGKLGKWEVKKMRHA